MSIRFTLDHGVAERRERVLADVGAMCVAVDPHAPERVYVGTLDQGLFVTHDGGTTWHRT